MKLGVCTYSRGVRAVTGGNAVHIKNAMFLNGAAYILH